MSDIDDSSLITDTDRDSQSRTLQTSNVDVRTRNTKGQFQKGLKKMDSEPTRSPPVTEDALRQVVERITRLEQENALLRAQQAASQTPPTQSVEDSQALMSGALEEDPNPPRRSKRSKEHRRRRRSSSSDCSYHSVRPQPKTKIINTIDKLDDGKSPDWEEWLIAIDGRLEFNKDHYPTEAERKFLVYSHTTGKAELHLRYKPRTIRHSTPGEI